MDFDLNRKSCKNGKVNEGKRDRCVKPCDTLVRPDKQPRCRDAIDRCDAQTARGVQCSFRAKMGSDKCGTHGGPRATRRAVREAPKAAPKRSDRDDVEPEGVVEKYVQGKKKARKGQKRAKVPGELEDDSATTSKRGHAQIMTLLKRIERLDTGKSEYSWLGKTYDDNQKINKMVKKIEQILDSHDQDIEFTDDEIDRLEMMRYWKLPTEKRRVEHEKYTEEEQFEPQRAVRVALPKVKKVKVRAPVAQPQPQPKPQPKPPAKAKAKPIKRQSASDREGEWYKNKRAVLAEIKRITEEVSKMPSGVEKTRAQRALVERNRQFDLQWSKKPDFKRL
jgi:hypothetical protein